MRVVHLTRSAWPHPGGLEASIEGLARAQVSRGLQVSVVTLRGADVDSDGIHRTRLRRCGPARYPFAHDLPKHVAGADVVHVHGLDGLADQAVRLHPRVGISTHGGFFHTDRQPVAKAMVLRWWTRRSLARAKAVWFSSEADRDCIGGSGEVLGDGIDLPSNRALRPVPGRWVVPGRVDVHKGVDDLIRLTMRLGLQPQIRVVGPEAHPGLMAHLCGRAGTLDVCFVGRVSGAQWLDELLSAERVICPSRKEGFGIAAAEALALGIPTVLSDIPAFCEHLGHPGVNFRGNDTEGFLTALEMAPTLVDVRRARMARHSWDQVVMRVQAAYEGMF